MARHGVRDQLLGQLTGLRGGHAPRDDVAAEDVEHQVEFVVLAAPGPLQLGDVPTPDDVRSGGDQFGLHLRGVGGLPTTLADLAVRPQQPVVRRLRGQVDALVEQRVEHLRGGAVDEARRAQRVQDGGSLGGGELVRRCRSRPPMVGRRLVTPAVVAGSGPPDRAAGRPRSEQWLDRAEARLGHDCCLVSSSLPASSRAKSSDAFPWISSACLCLASCSSRRALRLRSRSSSWRYPAQVGPADGPRHAGGSPRR